MRGRSLAILLAGIVTAQSPSVIQIGRVSVVYWPGEEHVAVTLGEIADRSGDWPGIPARPGRPIRLVLAVTAARFDSLTAGAVPDWSGGVTYPASGTIVLRLRGDPRQVLRHELAHLALRGEAASAPRWLDEGYASRAAGEFDRIDVLRVNWALLTGRPPTLDQVDAALQGSATTAQAAYAYAATAVEFLERLGRPQGLGPVLAALRRHSDLDRALRATHGVTLDQFEALWRQDLTRRFGWILFLTSFAGFWSVMALFLVGLWWWRRGRDAERRSALDQGWIIPPDDIGPSA